MKVISENYMQKFIVYHHRLLNWKKVITLLFTSTDDHVHLIYS